MRPRAGTPLAFAVLIACLTACDAGAPASARIATDSTAAALPDGTAAIEVPFRLAGVNDAAVIVPVHVNGTGPFDFVLDTGATMTCLDAALERRLDLEPEPGNLGFGLDAGRPGHVQLVRIDSLRLGGATATDLRGCILDLAHIQQAGFDVHGLVGLNFLKTFRVTLDFEKQVLVLER